jgi:hypothetical protein
MKASKWLKALAGVMTFFTVGHTMGVLNPPADGSAAEALDVMRRARFPIMGFERSYWEFYRGLGWFVSVELAVVAVFAWQLSAMSRRRPSDALPLVFTLELVCVASAILSWMYFFAAPMITSLIALICGTGATVALAKEARAHKAS